MIDVRSTWGLHPSNLVYSGLMDGRVLFLLRRPCVMDSVQQEFGKHAGSVSLNTREVMSSHPRVSGSVRRGGFSVHRTAKLQRRVLFTCAQPSGTRGSGRAPGRNQKTPRGRVKPCESSTVKRLRERGERKASGPPGSLHPTMSARYSKGVGV